ncbi:OmpH family outer membrane protein [Paucidesulfovibrio longus]|uniref:OmpH family outer membrane protein n=1 Tax=Paucidesulfovibrio longus TaxID=889 RepID=UPI0003B43515|nr:OmpH family outer membrane protein [Paucidesulfovibrio longus]
MLRKVLVVALLILPLLAGCNQESAKSGGIAVVDMTRVQKESDLVKRIQTHLSEMNNSLMTEALAADKARKESPSEENDKAFNETMSRLQGSMQAEQERLGGYLGQELKRIMEEYRTEKKLDALLLKETVAAVDPSLDVTDEILKRLDTLDPGLEAPAAAEQPAVEEAPAAGDQPAVESAPAPEAEQPAAEGAAPEAPAKPAE